MFQSFSVTARPEQGPPRLARLRDAMEDAQLDGFLVPRADVHQGEYVAARDERLSWLTGFTGSAGFAAILQQEAGLFVDGRYRTQVKAQAAAEFTPVNWPETSLAEWLKGKLGGGAVVGYDPWLHTIGQIETLTQAISGTDIALRQTDNLVDRIWTDRPGPPQGQINAHPLDFAGEAHGDKRARLGATLREAGHASAVLTLPDSIMWLLNIRGSDIPRNPLAQCFAILHQDGSVDLMVDPAKLTGLGDHLGPDIRCHPYEALAARLADLAGPVRIDKATAPQAIADLLAERAAFGEEPCLLPKARKNTAEIRGTVEAHLRDGAAMAELLSWLDAQPPGTLTEIDVVRRLEAQRAQDNALRDISFDTIAGTGPNGAVMHYRVTEETDARLQEGHLLVLDSGGQYLDGTTDITRTIPIGTVGQVEKQAFTRVLQGMIAISRLRWPEGLAGRDIEALGRAPLWAAGQDFDHGLGHGVGTYLCVHEGPQRLSRLSTVPLEPGMILSNEPGYYREGAFGIRLENLIVVEQAPALEGGDAHRAMLCWRNLTWVPIDRRMILTDMLSAPERDWIDTYHQEVATRIAPRVSDGARQWLIDATGPL